MADTVNMLDPNPPIPRRRSNWLKDCDSPANALDADTMISPVDMTTRSPRRSTRAPDNGEVMNRTSANAEMTELASSALTPKERAKTGNAGARMPKPSATQKATAERIATSRGRPASSGVRRMAPPSRFRPLTADGAVGADGADGRGVSLRHSILRPVPPSAVYAAEDQWSAVLDRGGEVDFFGSHVQIPCQRRFGDLDAVQRYVDGVLALPFVATEYPAATTVTVRERSGQRRAHYEEHSSTVAIPFKSTWAARESVVLHELAHHLASSLGSPTGSRRQWHGLAYRQAMCALVDAVLGAEAAMMLRAGYEEVGLRTVGPA